MIKGPRVVEHLARVDTVVFDKTGTLTRGTPHVSRIVTFDPRLTEDDLIALAEAAERGLRHPAARAIVAAATARRVRPLDATAAAQKIGVGVEVDVEGHHVVIGSRRLMESHGIDVQAAAEDESAARMVGASPIFVARDGELVGMIVLQDQLRDDAPDAVRALRARKMRNVIMLSGDHAEPTRVTAEVLGLRHHYAEFLPEEKARLIQDLKAEGRVVAMVGDGVNDALALDVADVGIVVSGGAEIAAEAADVVVLRGGLEQVVRTIDLGRESLAVVRRTLGIAARTNLLVVGLASLGLASPVTSILLSHGTAVAAALIDVTAVDGRSPIGSLMTALARTPGRHEDVP
jgi:P-type Cu2+ transporter